PRAWSHGAEKPARRAGARHDLRLFLIGGQHPRRARGPRLLTAPTAARNGRVPYLGVGGEGMEREGLASQFPLSDVAVMGPLSILPRLQRPSARAQRSASDR